MRPARSATLIRTSPPRSRRPCASPGASAMRDTGASRTPIVEVSAKTASRSAVPLGVAGEHAERVRRPALLHEDRHEPRVGGARLEQRGQHRRPHPRVQVVDVRLQDPHRSPASARPACDAEDHADDVGPPGTSRPPAPDPDRRDLHRRQSRRTRLPAPVTRAMPVGVASSPSPPARTRQPLGQLEDRGWRHRQVAVGGADPARSPPRPGSPITRVDTQVGERRRTPRRCRRSSPTNPPRGSAPRRGDVRGPAPRRRRAGERGERAGRAPRSGRSAASQQGPDAAPTRGAGGPRRRSRRQP